MVIIVISLLHHLTIFNQENVQNITCYFALTMVALFLTIAHFQKEWKIKGEWMGT